MNAESNKTIDTENLTEENKVAHSAPMVPYIVHESDMARMERINRRNSIFHVIVEILLIGIIVFGIYEWMQYDYVSEITTETIDQDSEGNGVNNYIGQDGDIVNGTAENNKNNEKNEQDPQGQ